MELRFQLGSEGLEPDRVRIALVVDDGAPARLHKLDAALRLFDHGGTWTEVVASGAEEKRQQLRLFADHVRAAWPKTYMPTDAELVALARIFRIVPLPDDLESPAWCVARSSWGANSSRMWQPGRPV